PGLGGQELASWVAPFAEGASLGLTAGGILTAVAYRRHRQRQQRCRGRRIALPVSGNARRAEHELHEAAARGLPGTLRTPVPRPADGLLASGQPVPAIAGVHLTPTMLEVLLNEPAATPPAPFTVKPASQDRCWLLSSATWAALPAVNGTGRGDLLPGL